MGKVFGNIKRVLSEIFLGFQMSENLKMYGSVWGLDEANTKENDSSNNSHSNSIRMGSR